MRRTILTTVTTVGGIALLLGLKSLQPLESMMSANPTAPSVSSPAPPGGTTPPHAGSTGGGRTPSTTTSTYVGDTIQTAYGPVQVKITVVDGEMTAVDMLQLPTANARDQQIAATAIPALTDEVLSAQSTAVDSISGATYTSEGYLQSLQSALDQIHG